MAILAVMSTINHAAVAISRMLRVSLPVSDAVNTLASPTKQPKISLTLDSELEIETDEAEVHPAHKMTLI